MRACLLVLLLAAAQAAPLQPRSDDEIVQRLDSAGSERLAQRALQRRLHQEPRHEPSALRLASQLLAQARSQGDARFAGRALAVLQAFGERPAPPVAVLRATLLQHLHDFEQAASLLERTLQDHSQQAQAWLLLASVRRTQGRLADSDQACKGLSASGGMQHGAACRLENASLRAPDLPLSHWDALRSPELDAATQAWLLSAKAEHALRAGRGSEAERAFRAALALHDEAYTRCALADLLHGTGRTREALALLLPLPASDAVAVRRTALALALGDARATVWAADLQSRFAEAAEREQAAPTDAIAHLREQAQFALWVQRQPALALKLARANLAQQREPIDLLLLAQAGGQDEAERLARQWGIRDARLAAH